MAALGQPFKAQFFDADGHPLASGKVYATLGYSNIPVITFANSAKTEYNPNPILLDERGESGIWSNTASYNLAVYDVNDILVSTSATYPPAPPVKATFYDLAGDPLAGGKIYTYEAGTSTPMFTYTDASGVTENTNPVILDSNGQADLWFGSSLYKIILKTATDVEIYSVDNYGA